MSKKRLNEVDFSNARNSAGKAILQRTKLLPNGFKRLVPVVGATRFLSNQEQLDAAASIRRPDGTKKHEKHLIAYMTAHLRAKLLSVFPDYFELVNSEEYNWMAQGDEVRSIDLAPDQFIAPHYLVNYRLPYAGAPKVEGANYGEFALQLGYRSVGAFVFSKKVNDGSALADLARSLENGSQEDTYGPVICRGVVYDAESVVLMKSISGCVFCIHMCNWTDEGSYDFIREFFDPADLEVNWHTALQAYCTTNNLVVPRYNSASLNTLGVPNFCAVLGAGASGRVFRVNGMNGEATNKCVKIVLDSDRCEELSLEFQLVSNIPNTCDNLIVRVCDNSLVMQSVQGLQVGGFTLNMVGKPFNRLFEVNDNDIRGMLTALSNLHGYGVVHGDARFRNCVKLIENGQNIYRWIDFRDSPEYNVEADMVSFFKSINLKVGISDIKKYARNVTDKLNDNEAAWWNSDADRVTKVLSLLELDNE